MQRALRGALLAYVLGSDSNRLRLAEISSSISRPKVYAIGAQPIHDLADWAGRYALMCWA